MSTIAPVIVKVSDRKLIERLMSNPIRPTRLFLTMECTDGELKCLYGWPVCPDALRRE